MTELSREPCPQCKALKGDVTRNNLAVHEDGGKYCYACGYVEKANGQNNKGASNNMRPLIAGAVEDLLSRGITLETCQKYNVRQVIFTGYLSKEHATVENEKVKIFPIYKDGRVVKQKVKLITDKKAQGQFGETDSLNLFGMNCFSPNKSCPVIVTEGEEDAMSGYQLTGWPHVSITRGAKGAYKELVANYEWLSGWKEVILCFDNDVEGRKAVTDCISIFDPGTVKNCLLPLKDVNEMLKEGRTAEEYRKYIWSAESFRPSTLVSLMDQDLRKKILTPPSYGRPFPWPSLTKCTYGLRRGESYLLAGPTSAGKTEVVRAIISHIIADEELVGYFQFEQQPEQTAQRFVGSNLNKRLHIPGEEWNEELIEAELKKIENYLWLYNTGSAATNIESVILNIKYLNKCYGIWFFVVDNLKALAKNPVIAGKRVAVHEYASHCMSEITSLCKQLNINILTVNHLSEDKIALQAYVSTSPKNPDEYLGRTAEGMQSYINRPGMTWENGRVPSIQNIFGGGAIKDLTDYIMVIARNRMSEDNLEHRTIRVKMLKTRLDSNFENFEFRIVYNYETGSLTEVYDQDISNRDKNRDGINLPSNQNTKSLE